MSTVTSHLPQGGAVSLQDGSATAAQGIADRVAFPKALDRPACLGLAAASGAVGAGLAWGGAALFGQEETALGGLLGLAFVGGLLPTT